VFGLIAIVGLFFIFGFLLAWVVGVVSSEEISVKKGFWLALPAFVVASFACVFAQATPVSAVAPLVGGLVGGTAVMVLIRLSEKSVYWKDASIIGAVYTLLIAGVCWMAF
jgi:hypothetical protein